MESGKVTIQQEETSMSDTNQSLTERIEAKLNAFNQRLEARFRKNQTLLENMWAEEDFKKSMGYMMEFFGLKKEV